MWTMDTVSLLLIVLVELLVGLAAWRFLRAWTRQAVDSLMAAHDDVLFGPVPLAAFTMGVFLAYIFVSWTL